MRQSFQYHSRHPTNIYLFKGSNRNTRTRCEICSKLVIKKTERCQGRRSGVVTVNFEHIISYLFLVFSIGNFVQVEVSWVFLQPKIEMKTLLC